MQISQVAGTSIGPYFLGVAYDRDGSYRIPLQCIVVVGVCVSILQTFMRPPGDAPDLIGASVVGYGMLTEDSGAEPPATAGGVARTLAAAQR